MRNNFYAACIFFFIALLSLFSPNVLAQQCPDSETLIFPDLQGAVLYDSLRAAYKTSTVLSYDGAREVLYGEIDNEQGIVGGIYTGYEGAIDPQAGNVRSQANDVNINAEHSWPQSKGASDGTLGHSDMHHLYPAYGPANSSRGNDPFIDIPDDQTDGWWRYDQQVTTPVADSIDYYSERRDSHPSSVYTGSWEPREMVKGDIARSIFYFYTMYRNEAMNADPNFFDAQKTYLRTWNIADTVSTKEYQRTCAIAEYQQGKVNPFVIDPTLADRLYFAGEGNQTVVEFNSSSITLYENEGAYQIEVDILNPNPDTATTVLFSYAGGSAAAGADFENPGDQTLTFEAGSSLSKKVTLNLIDDSESEKNERIFFALSDISGPENAVIGVSDSLEITLKDDDGQAPSAVWFNEFHYDNEGTDTGEFVEIAVNSETADLSRLTLTLYNGSNGSVYNSITGDQFTFGESQNGFSVYYVEFPSNGLQNGSPDGMSLDLDGELVQFISYEGTFAPGSGPASGFESTDVGKEESNSSPLSSSIALEGSGNNYADFSWILTDQSSMGKINPGQTFTEATSTDKDASADLPGAPVLHPNYPNPFNPVTQISYELNQPGIISLRVYTPSGRLVSEVVKGYQSAGFHQVNFDASGLSSGLYLYRLTAGDFSQIRKMMLIK